MMTLMTLGFSCLKTIHIQYYAYETGTEGQSKSPETNIMNNNSVPQETSTEEVFTETVQDTQTQN